MRAHSEYYMDATYNNNKGNIKEQIIYKNENHIFDEW